MSKETSTNKGTPGPRETRGLGSAAKPHATTQPSSGNTNTQGAGKK
jgi:hypothetical protein